MNLITGLSVAFLAVLIAAAEVQAETKKRLYSSGSWALYQVDGFEFVDRKAIVLDNMCVAETSVTKGRLTVSMFPKEATRAAPDTKGMIIGQIVSENWKLATRRRDMKLSSGAFSYTIGGADYGGNTIQFAITGDHAPMAAFSMLAEMGNDRVTVHNSDGTALAQFSLSGYSAVLKRLFKCAGIR